MAEKVIIDVDFQTNAEETTSELDDLKKELEEIKGQLEGIKEQEKKTTSALGKLSKGFKGLGLATKAMGIGLLVEAFNLLKEIIMQNQPIVDALDKATTALGIVFNQVADVVVDLGTSLFDAFNNPKETISDLLEFIKSQFVNRLLGYRDQFIAFGDILEGVFTFDWDKVKEGASDFGTAVIQVATGLDAVQQTEVAEFFTETATAIATATTNAIEMANSLVEQRNAVRLLEAEQVKLNFTYLREQELQRQVRDDVSKTFEERIAANVKLGQILDEQLVKEKEIVDAKIQLAKDELSVNKDSIELQEALIQAEAEGLDLQERITGFRSEQLTNEIGLMQEQKDARDQLRIATLSEREAELESLRQDYEAKLELARLTGEATVEITKRYNEALALEQSEYDAEQLDAAKKISDALLAEEKAASDASKEISDNLKAQQKEELQAKQQAIAVAGSLFEEGSAMAKASGIANATISTYQAVAGALAEPPFTAKNFLTAGIALATGLKSVKSILAVKTKKSVPTPTAELTSIPTDAASSTSSSLDTLADLSNAPTITESFNDQFGGGQAPIQAYVVEQNVTDAQQINTMIEQNSTL